MQPRAARFDDFITRDNTGRPHWRWDEVPADVHARSSRVYAQRFGYFDEVVGRVDPIENPFGSEV